MIRVCHLRQRLGESLVLDDVSFTVAPGQVVALVGPSEGGKSTLLRVLATLEEPTAGTVEVASVDVLTDPDAVRRTVGYLGDTERVDPGVTAYEHLADVASARGVAPRVVDDVMELVDLTGQRNQVGRRLTQGVLRRLGVARVLLHDPSVVLLDDVATGLDPAGRWELAALLSDLARLGKTVVWTSGSLSDLGRDPRILVLAHGRLVGELTATDAPQVQARTYMALTEGAPR